MITVKIQGLRQLLPNIYALLDHELDFDESWMLKLR